MVKNCLLDCIENFCMTTKSEARIVDYDIETKKKDRKPLNRKSCSQLFSLHFSSAILFLFFSCILFVISLFISFLYTLAVDVNRYNERKQSS